MWLKLRALGNAGILLRRNELALQTMPIRAGAN